MEQLYLTARIFNAFAQNIGEKMKNLGHNFRCPKLFWESGIFNLSAPVCYKINRYSRGLETCPQAKTSESGHGIFFFFSDASERRVWLSADAKILASTLVLIRLYRLKQMNIIRFNRPSWKNNHFWKLYTNHLFIIPGKNCDCISVWVIFYDFGSLK